MAKAKQAVPSGYHTITPMLTLDDASEAIDWYKKAFGAEERSRAVGPDDVILHAELAIGDSRFMLHDTMMGDKGPKAYGGSPAGCWLYVNDCDTLFNRAVAAGATIRMPIENAFWGDRTGMVVDPFGYTWAIAQHIEDLTPDEIAARQAEWVKSWEQE